MIQASTAAKPLLDSSTSMEAERIKYAETEESRSNRFGRILKILVDYSLTIPGLILISPLLLLIAIMIKLDSPGPVIHRRRVLGVNGRVFYALKFRTMYVNNDEILAAHPRLRAELNKNYEVKRDPRLTRIGQFLCQFSLDELPQLFNVLFQDMSLVGPRVITPHEIAKYGRFGEALLTAMPGLTGLWQISARSDTSYDDRVKLDMEYISNWSIWMDVKILLRTIPTVMKGGGAY